MIYPAFRSIAPFRVCWGHFAICCIVLIAPTASANERQVNRLFACVEAGLEDQRFDASDIDEVETAIQRTVLADCRREFGRVLATRFNSGDDSYGPALSNDESRLTVQRRALGVLATLWAPFFVSAR
jgi:hypothetical protein